MPQPLLEGDALLLVDVQNDFIPGGALPVPEGDQVIPVLNEWIAAALEAEIPIYASRDWHPFNHCSFKEEGGPWPPHCVQGTSGAEFFAGLDYPDEAVTILSKGEHPDREGYSAFQGTDFARMLKTNGIKRLWIGGLALDYCVRASTLDAAKEGVEPHVILAGTRAITEETGHKALEELRQAGAVIEE